MSTSRLRATLLLGSVPLLAAVLVGSAQAAPAPPAPSAPSPAPGASATGTRPEGPWPPGAVLAQDPARVAVPNLTAAVPTTSCPTAPYGVNHYAPGTGKTVALTFDDGPGVTTAALLSILEQNAVPATFFNVGVNAAVRPTLVRSEAVLGEVIANHTWDHPEMPFLTASEQAAEMDRATAEQNLLVGIRPCLFRPPYGEYNATTLSLAQQRGMAVWNWSVDTEDWKAGTSTSSYWINRIITRAEAGGSQEHPVVLMHNPPAGIPATVAALPTIIGYYRSHGYQFINLLGDRGLRASTPAAATTSGGLHLFVRASTGAVEERTLTGSTWSGWRSLGANVVGGPAAVALGPTTTAVVAVGANNTIYRTTVTDAGAVSGWVSLGGATTSRPGIAVAPNGVESVVIRATNAQAYLRERTGGQWGSWQSLGGVLAPMAPAAAVTADDALTVAAVGTDESLVVKTRSTAGGWSAWRRVGGTIDADVALAPNADHARLVAVVRNPGNLNGYVTVGNAAATSWTGWTSLGGVLASGAAVTVIGPALDVFAVGTDGRLYRKIAANGTLVTGWSGWQALP